LTIELKLDEKQPNIIDAEFTEKDIEINERPKRKGFFKMTYISMLKC